MIVDEPGQPGIVTSHHIQYDWDNPSPVFSAAQIQYVDAIKTLMSSEDMANLRKVELVVYNAFTQKCGGVVGRAKQREIDAQGDLYGCHICGAPQPGTRSGSWVGDHQAPTAINPLGQEQVLYPQCKHCSNRQGGFIKGLLNRGLRR